MSQPPASAATSAETALPVIDENLFASLQQDLPEEMMPELIESFLGELNERLAALSRAIDSADWAAIALQGHTLKGSAAIFGATALRASAEAMENAGNQRSIETARQCLATVSQQARAAAGALAQRYPSITPPPAAAG